MENESNLIKRIKADLASVLGRTDVAVVLSDGTFAYSDYPKSIDELIREEVLRSFVHWNKGDYFVKHLDNSNLLIGKMTDNTAIAVNSVSKLGLMIVAFQRIMKLTSLESGSIAEAPGTVAVAEAKAPRGIPELDTGLAASRENKKVEALEPPQSKLIREKPGPAAPGKRSTGSPSSVNPWNVLEVTSSQNEDGIALDSDMIRLLRIVDGRKSAMELAEETGIDLQEALSKLTFLKEKDVLKLKYVEPIYQGRPKLNGTADQVEAGTMALGSSFGKIRNLKDLLKRMDGKKTVLTLARELEIDPEKLKVMVENLERKKVIKI